MNYTVTIRDDTEKYETRKLAIEAARDASGEVRGEVRVEDEPGVEVLCFRRGELTSYLWDTRR